MTTPEPAPVATPRKRLVRRLRIVMPLVGLACFLAFAPVRGIWAWVLPLPDTIQEQLDQSVGLGLDGAVVFVDRAGAPPALHAAGWHDRDAKIPADPSALFKIGSISKLYVAAAAARLASEGRLSLDAPLTEHLPALAGEIEHAAQITVRMLLRHRSGIPNYVDVEGFDWGAPPPDAAARLQLVLGRPADFEPDTDRAYSNTNFLLLGQILDGVVGGDHRAYVRDTLLAPLGLTNTYGTLRAVPDLDAVSSGYHVGYEPDTKAVDFNGTAGSMVATAAEVGAFVRALADGSLLGAKAQALYTSFADFGHTGWVLGYHSIARYHQDRDTVVVQLVNTTGGDRELLTNVTYDRVLRILGQE